MKGMIARLVALVLAVSVAGGCHYFYDRFGEQKRIPSPIEEQFPFEMEGQIYRVWRGNELQIKHGEHTTYLILQGVNNPDMEEPVEQQSIAAVYELLDATVVEATVHATDSKRRCVAQVRCGEHDINLEMIQNGWAQWDGTEFERADDFKQAEAKAKAEKLGMWGID